MLIIENDFPIPQEETEAEPATETAKAPATEKAKPKPRARRKAEQKANPAAPLLAALKFIAPAQRKMGAPSQQFCKMSGGWVAASDGVLTIATPIAEDLEACPHTLQLINALSKTSEELAITQLSAETIAVKSGRFMALVPCGNPGEVPITAPDPICAALTDAVKQSLGDVMGLATEGAQVAHYAAVLLQAGSAVATNGFAMLESWHGVDLPPGLLIPKTAAAAIAKSDKALTGFGFSQTSATFYFEDGSFIKTQLYAERYPAYLKVFESIELKPWPIPEEFFKAVKALESFSQNGIVFFNEGVLSSDVYVEEASTYKIEGLPNGMGFNAKYLLQLEAFFEKAHFDASEKTNHRVFFFKGNVRGVLMGVNVDASKQKRETQDRQPTAEDFESPGPYDWANMDDDIPF